MRNVWPSSPFRLDSNHALSLKAIQCCYLTGWNSLPDGEFLSFDSILKYFFSSSDENVLSPQSGQHPSTVLAHSFSPSCARLLPRFSSDRPTTIEKLVLVSVIPSYACSLTLCQFWSLLIWKKPRDRKGRKARDWILPQSLCRKQTLVRNDSKELGEKRAKAGLHCYHSNAELQKLEHGEMGGEGGGRAFIPWDEIRE